MHQAVTRAEAAEEDSSQRQDAEIEKLEKEKRELLVSLEFCVLFLFLFFFGWFQ